MMTFKNLYDFHVDSIIIYMEVLLFSFVFFNRWPVFFWIALNYLHEDRWEG